MYPQGSLFTFLQRCLSHTRATFLIKWPLFVVPPSAAIHQYGKFAALRDFLIGAALDDFGVLTPGG